MSEQVEIKLGERSYRLTVPLDQQPRLRDVAAKVDELFKPYAGSALERDRIFALVALELADQVLTFEKSTGDAVDTDQLKAFHTHLAQRIRALVG